MSACVCGSGAETEACCGPLHAGRARAQTAEALMRSRYAAFALGKVDYLTATQSKPFAEGQAAVAAWAQRVAWLGLTVLEREGGQLGDEGGFVTFEARYLERGEVVTMHERSRFVRGPSTPLGVSGAPPAVSGAGAALETGPVPPFRSSGVETGPWLYADGTLEVTRQRAERNGPCPCGSGKKFKHCHA